ncbi:alpha/beta hydrolase [Streptomyces roseirectus]|uniref:Alpha/beta hydrolase n=1 Tax=Streptomyces roseirectus TaxID=2768066 RepID=A0A7H0IP81_9ACTN|nr:alpha/beta hydrolase [Streptomyces roseirectus]QNP74597.1 alpha/beta hydrolase [Streptomyces roseirectus]
MTYDHFTAPDGTRLAHHTSGAGTPLVCLPGGPTDSAYLGDLGGLTARHRLIRLDLRGTGRSAVPADAASYRCDRMVDDVEALRVHLGLERVNLLAHCAGANLAALYAARHPERVARLALVTPSTRAVGLTIPGELRLTTARKRRGEPWFPDAYAALEAISAGRADAGAWEAVAPFSYGRWDAVARAHHAGEALDPVILAAYGADGAYEPARTRAGLARLAAPVLVVAGSVDVVAPPGVVGEFAGVFPDAEVVVQEGGGHFPWLDRPEEFAQVVGGFFGE